MEWSKFELPSHKTAFINTNRNKHERYSSSVKNKSNRSHCILCVSPSSDWSLIKQSMMPPLAKSTLSRVNVLWRALMKDHLIVYLWLLFILWEKKQLSSWVMIKQIPELQRWYSAWQMAHQQGPFYYFHRKSPHAREGLSGWLTIALTQFTVTTNNPGWTETLDESGQFPAQEPRA